MHDGSNMKRRNFFRFSLGAVFVLLTVLCLVSAYVGYEYRWVRARRAFLADSRLSARVGLVPAGKKVKSLQFPAGSTTQYHGEPRLLYLFDELKMDSVGVWLDEQDVDWTRKLHGFIAANHPRLRHAQRLFPEAIVVPFCQRNKRPEVLFVND